MLRLTPNSLSQEALNKREKSREPFIFSKA
jgi:hypothetical protein